MKPLNKQIMIDIETLGIDADSVIIQLGATVFDISDPSTTVQPGIEFDIAINDQLEKRTLSNNTVAWWLDTTNPSSRLATLERKKLVSLYIALTELNEFIDQFDSPNIWANAPSFDLLILKNAMLQLGIEPAWKYYQEKDVRVITYIYDLLHIVKPKRTSVTHSSLGDAQHQADLVKTMLNNLQETYSI